MPIIASMLLGGLSWPAAALAAPREPVTFAGQYQCSFSGIPIARLGIEMDEKDTRYTATTDVTISGLLSIFVKHSSHTTAAGSGTNFNFSDITYETNYHTNKKSRYATLVYHNGDVTTEKVSPPDSTEKRPAVPAELKKSTTDPLTLVLTMRHKLIEALASGSKNYTINVYDGRRLIEVDFTVLGKREITEVNGITSVIAVSAKRKLLAGHTQDELKKFNPDESPLLIYFSDDDRLWPVRLETRLSLGVVAATLTKECAPGESCLLGIKN